MLNGDGATSAGDVSERRGVIGDRSYRLLNCDAIAGLRSLPDESVDVVVTSPPYFWQRDYGVDGQIGHEPTIQGFVEALGKVFDEAKRVLARDGTLFLNLGDSYYNAKGKPHGEDKKHAARIMSRQQLRAVDGPGLGLPRKSLIGLPWRVAIRLQDGGWTLRSSIIWHRPGNLGEPSSHDRPWRSHENLFLFSKGPKYRFDRTTLLAAGEEDVWSIAARPRNTHAHCAPYPEELVERCLGCVAKPGGIVLDPFAGSGTTLKVALSMGMNAIGIDLNPEYVEIAERRLLG